MSNSKFVTTNPDDLVGKVDGDSISSISSNGEGNSVILESINKDQPKSSFDTYAAVAQGQAVATKAMSIGETLKAIDTSDGFSVDTITSLSSNDRDKLLEDLGGSLGAMGELGDVIGVGEVASGFEGMGLPSFDFFESLKPDLSFDLLSNLDLNIGGLGLSDIDLTRYLDDAAIIFGNFSPTWYWLDQSRGIYDYDKLARIGEYGYLLMSNLANYEEVVVLGMAIAEHEDNA